MSSALSPVSPVSATAEYKEVLGQIDKGRALAALSDPKAAVEYANELSQGFVYLATVAQKVEGQKALHGAYVYRMLATTAHRGKVIVDGEKVALGQVVGKRLGRFMGRYDSEGQPILEPVQSGSVTRYRYISVLVFDAGYSPEDPDWSDLVNYYVSTPEMAALLKQHRDPDHKEGARVITREEVEAVVKSLRAPIPAVVPKADDIEGETEGDTEDSQGPENLETEGGEDTEGSEGDTEDTEGSDTDGSEDSEGEVPTDPETVLAPSDRAPRVPAHEITEGLPRGIDSRLDWAETVVFGLKREDVQRTTERVRRLTVMIEHLQTLV